MKAIIVDDEPVMISSFLRTSKGIEDLEIVETFESAAEALEYARNNPVELAFLDVKMPGMNGVELAEQLKEIHPGILLVFVSAYDEYIREFNRVGGDYYIVKPYRAETLETAMEKIRLLAKRQKKPVCIRTFGRFTVMKEGVPLKIRGKAKEILALIVTRRGHEISNEEIYRTIWEDRVYSNAHMSVYYNALGRLRKRLEEEGLENLIISTAGGQMANVSLFDCDYYEWLDGKKDAFRGEFLSEYSWGEYILAGMLRV